MEGQISCNDCENRRVQLIEVSADDNLTTLKLLCLDCGLVNHLEISGTPVIRADEPKKKAKVSYTG